MVKCLPTMWKTRVRSLGWEDPLEKEMATHSSILAWKIPWTEEPGRLQFMGLQRVGHDWETSLHYLLSWAISLGMSTAFQIESLFPPLEKKKKRYWLPVLTTCPNLGEHRCQSNCRQILGKDYCVRDMRSPSAGPHTCKSFLLEFQQFFRLNSLLKLMCLWPISGVLFIYIYFFLSFIFNGADGVAILFSSITALWGKEIAVSLFLLLTIALCC